MKIIEEKILNEEESLEYQTLKKIYSEYLVKLVNDSFYSCDKYYCFVMEYCEVNINLLLLSKFKYFNYKRGKA
jgi:hypothetical protein